MATDACKPDQPSSEDDQPKAVAEIEAQPCQPEVYSGTQADAGLPKSLDELPVARCEEPRSPKVEESHQPMQDSVGKLERAGLWAGSERVQHLARQANRHLPELTTHDRFGHRIDEVEFHPAYHELMTLVFGSEAHALAWTDAQPGAHVARGVLSYLWNQGENGVCCPMGMTFASIARERPRHPGAMAGQDPVTGVRPPRGLRGRQGRGHGRHGHDGEARWLGPACDHHHRPASSRSGPGAEYLLTGHKWFFSAPMSDLFLTLAQTDGGLCCFLATGWLPDGSRNRLKIQRLKDKCGNKSNASSEVEFYDLQAVMLGEEGHGIRTWNCVTE